MPHNNKIHPTNIVQSLMRSPLGNFIARSWLDKLILSSLEHWFFPLSRLWAAARRSNGDTDEFFTSVPMQPISSERLRITKALKIFETKRQQILQTESNWQEAFFSPTSPSTEKLVKLESLRLKHRNHYNSTRYKFRKLKSHLTTSVYNNFSSESQLEAAYPRADEQLEEGFSPPSQLPEITHSHSIPTHTGRDYWIRFKTPSKHLNDIVYARVHEPEGVSNPPTLIFGHGIGVEFDHWKNLVDVAELLPHLGIRVIRPEAPWHGRRVPDGYYGGEYFLSTTPLGAFDFFTAQHQEWAVLIDWSRKTSTGPVAIGGSSLGAQSAQMTAIRAKKWPKHYQPDALFLMTHCSHLWEVALDGDLADIWGLHIPLHKMGWNRERMEKWLSKLDPEGAPCMPAKNIISVLGKEDRVTPYRSGKRVQELWNIPDENRYKWPCGHFTVPLRMARDHAPLFQLKEILNNLR